MNTQTISANGSPVKGSAAAARRLRANGYAADMRPCAPPGARIIVRDEIRIASGKRPSVLAGDVWKGLKNWQDRHWTADDFRHWQTYDDANWCVVLGEIVALDIDVKFNRDDRSQAASEGRQFLAAVEKAAAEQLRIEPGALARRIRSNSTSCAFLFRAREPMQKRLLRLTKGADAAATHHGFELLASGQQIVVAGRHESGGVISSDLERLTIDRLPLVSRADVEAIFVRIANIGKDLGFVVGATSATNLKHRGGPRSPKVAVTAETLRRRAEWLGDVLDIAVPAAGDLRVTSAQLGRDLEEDIEIYQDGIYDFGTERSHDPASLICEFGAIDDAGEITFGGCPQYGPRGGKHFAVVGEPDDRIRRPTTVQALTWLCNRLSGGAAEFAPSVTWAEAIPQMTREIGLDWGALLAAAHFDFETAGDDPLKWTSTTAAANGALLAALRVVNPKRFGDLNQAWTSDADLIADVAIMEALARPRESPASPGEPLPQPDQWQEPFDIFGDADPGDLANPPAGSLPPVILDWAKSESQRKGVSVAFAAGAAVATITAAIGCSLKIQPRRHDRTWQEPASLWVSLVAEPGRAKSPTIRSAVDPLHRLDSENYAADKPAHDRWAAAAKQRARKPSAPDPGPEPVIRRSTVDDVTMEQQIRLCAQNPRGLLRTPDELTGFFGSFGAYKAKGSGGDRSQALRLFDGGAVTVDRVGSGTLRAESALVAILAGTQPEKIAALAKELGADGMLQRFIFVCDDGREHRGRDEPPDELAAQRYSRVVRGLGGFVNHIPEPIRMSDEGQKLFDGAMATVSALKNSIGMPTVWKGHVEKWGKILPRLVLTFHAAETWSDEPGIDPSVRVAPGTVKRAVDFARFLLRHSMHFYRTFYAPDRATDEARNFAGYLLTHPEKTEVRHRTLYDAVPRLRGDEHHALRCRIFSELETAGWLRVQQREAGGPSVWTVCPLVHSRFAARASREHKERQMRQASIVRAAEARVWVSNGQDVRE